MIPANEVYEVIPIKKGRILSKFITDNLEGKIPEYHLIVSSAMNTISRFTLCKDETYKYVKTGLAFGKVQSGKTTYFLCASACALDNGFDMVIFLSGVTTNLLLQNKKRLQLAFPASRMFLDFYDTSNINSSVDDTIYLIKDFFLSLETEGNNGGVMISVLKEDSHLEKIASIVKSFKDKRILVVDDEGDQFTPNTKINQEKESTIYNLIKEIVNTDEKISLLSVTATPQANVFADKYNMIMPDFIELVEPGRGYCGLETFHSNNDYVCFVSGSKKHHTDELRKALIYYLFTLYETEFNEKEKYKERKNWMLIHNSRLKTDHLKDYKELSNILEAELKEVADYSSGQVVDVLEERLIEYIRNYYIEFDIKRKFKYNCEDFLAHFSKVMDCFYNTQKNINNISIINSDEKLEYADFQKSKCGILIGGNMLGRGITITDLTVTYITRDRADGKGNVDTILQRARWFGYREHILDLIKIFTTKELQSKFTEIYHHDISLYEEIKFCIENNIDLANSKLKVTIGDKLDLTRRNVILKGTLIRGTTSSFVQQRKMLYTPEYEIHEEINKNIWQYVSQLSFQESIKGIKIYDANAKEFFEIIIKYIENKDIYSINDRVYDSLKTLLLSKETIKIIVMKGLYDDSRGYTLSLDSGYTQAVYIGNVLSGASYQSGYEGDLYHFSSFDHIQLHFTKIKTTTGNELYSGNKVLFLAVNNTSIQKQGFIQRN